MASNAGFAGPARPLPVAKPSQDAIGKPARRVRLCKPGVGCHVEPQKRLPTCRTVASRHRTALTPAKAAYATIPHVQSRVPQSAIAQTHSRPPGNPRARAATRTTAPPAHTPYSPQLGRPREQIGEPCDAELPVEVRQVRLHRRLADAELGGDVSAHEAGSGELQYLALAGSEPSLLHKRRRKVLVAGELAPREQTPHEQHAHAVGVRSGEVERKQRAQLARALEKRPDCPLLGGVKQLVVNEPHRLRLASGREQL